MAYSEQLATRIRDVLDEEPGVEEKKMFGGLCFMIDGHMACGIVKDELMVRVGPTRYDEYLAQPHAREMDFTGRALKGMIYVGAEGIGTKRNLRTWLQRALRFVRSLPPK